MMDGFWFAIELPSSQEFEGSSSNYDYCFEVHDDVPSPKRPHADYTAPEPEMQEGNIKCHAQLARIYLR